VGNCEGELTPIFMERMLARASGAMLPLSDIVSVEARRVLSTVRVKRAARDHR